MKSGMNQRSCQTQFPPVWGECRQLLGACLFITMMTDDRELPQRVRQQGRLVVMQRGINGRGERHCRFGQRTGARVGFAGCQQLNCPPRLNWAGS